MDDDGTAALARVERALEARFPHRMVPDLARITDLLDLLGDPQRAYPSIHITGTNGKTSTARMIDALLQAFGIRTGRYTSPHLENITERVAISGSPLPAEAFAAVYDEVAPFAEIVDGRHPDRVTFFEILTAMAFAAFADAPVEVAVVEVGLGGRWDATNVLSAPVAVVTPIGLDHVGLLGDSVAEIAAEKAGIVHPGSTLVTAMQPPSALAALLARASSVEAPVVREGIDFGVRSRVLAVSGQVLSIDGLGGTYDELFVPLHGRHQAGNAAAALAAVEAFFGAGTRGRLDLDIVREGFATVTSPGRLEVVRRSPTILLDGAHNPAGAAALAEALGEEFGFSSLVAVVAVLDDKDAVGMLAPLEPVVSSVVATASGSPRALAAEALGEAAVTVFGEDRVVVVPRLDDAIDRAVALADDAGPGAGVLVTGSIVMIGEARLLLATERPR